MLHDVFAESFSAFDREEATDGCLLRRETGDEAGIGYDMAFAEERKMGREVVDVIEIRVENMLLQIEYVKARFDDLVEFGS